MNYLGHSMFNDKEKNKKVIFGNVCGDFFKGTIEKLDLDMEIKKGIALHRNIDKLTDSNEYFIRNKRLLSDYKLYSGVILDIFNDHFLAKNFNKFSNIPLNIHSNNIYEIIEEYYEFLNLKGQKTFYWMKRGDWLSNYDKFEFLEEVLYGISKRFKRENHIYKSVYDLKGNYSEFEENFFEFWNDISYIENKYDVS